MADLLEMAMMACFGVSWPLNVYKLWKARTTKGASIQFYFLIFIGYIFGLISKALKVAQGISVAQYVWFIYGLNTVFLMTAILVYYRNKRIETREQAE